MDVSMLYSFVLGIVLVGILIGMSIFILGKMQQSTGMDSTTIASLNATSNAIADIPTTWIPIIIIVAMVGIILYFLVKGVGGSDMR